MVKTEMITKSKTISIFAEVSKKIKFLQKNTQIPTKVENVIKFSVRSQPLTL